MRQPSVSDLYELKKSTNTAALVDDLRASSKAIEAAQISQLSEEGATPIRALLCKVGHFEGGFATGIDCAADPTRKTPRGGYLSDCRSLLIDVRSLLAVSD
ncbi:hypothetical protein MMC14_006105 [Varicellaria rhodocarpa]|nr:hypothetical protein [Varicellaria rhodocarpa]